MQKLVADLTYLRVGHIDVLVDKISIVPQLAPEQTDWLVASPPTVTDLLAEEVIPPRDAIGRFVGSSDNPGDLRR